jgi:hypothetical protein
VNRAVRVLTEVAVPLAYAAVAVVLLGPAIVTRCGDTLFGGAGDSTAGLIWLEWNYDVLGSWPFRSTTPLLNAPSGAPLWQPFYVTALVLMIPMWAASLVVGPVCSWNVVVLGGFILDGWMMHLFVRWLTRNVPVALLAGLAFLLLPYHYQKASGHLAYVHTWVFVLILWAGLRLAQRPTILRGAALGAAVATACYVDGYYLLIATTFGGAVAVIALVVSLGGANRATIGAAIRAVLASGVVLGLCLLPILVVLATSSSTISAAVERSASDVAVYSARPWEYVLPARHHPLLPDALGAWQDRHLHESNYSEQTLYLGALPMFGAVAAVGLAIRRRRPDDALAVKLGALVLVAGGGALVALLMSAPPTVAVGGALLPMPSRIISKSLAFWRVYSRFFIPVAVCAIALASSALAVVLSRPGSRSGRRAVLVAALLAPVVVVDFLPPRPPAAFSFERDTPAEYEWLDDRTPNQIIAEYPLDPPPLPNHITYLSYQRTHQQRLLNGAPAGSADGHLQRGLAGLADPQTVPTLARLGVRFVVVHPATYGHPVDEATLPATLTKVFEAPGGKVYRVDAGAAGPAALAPADGFHVTDTTGFTSSRWMRTRGTLDLHSFAADGALEVSFQAISFGSPRHLEIRQAGTVVWQGDIPADVLRDVTFSITRRAPLRLSASPGEVPIERLLPETHDDRRVTINVGELSIRRP